MDNAAARNRQSILDEQVRRTLELGKLDKERQ